LEGESSEKEELTDVGKEMGETYFREAITVVKI